MFSFGWKKKPNIEELKDRGIVKDGAGVCMDGTHQSVAVVKSATERITERELVVARVNELQRMVAAGKIIPTSAAAYAAYDMYGGSIDIRQEVRGAMAKGPYVSEKPTATKVDDWLRGD